MPRGYESRAYNPEGDPNHLFDRVSEASRRRSVRPTEKGRGERSLQFTAVRSTPPKARINLNLISAILK